MADLPGAVEALLMAADDPIEESTLAQLLDVPVGEVADCLADLTAFYRETGRGFELRRIAGGWRFYSREEYGEIVAAFLREGREAKLSQAALETLAVIAYLQPVSRGRISAVRGVNVEAVIRTLLARGLIEEAGADPESGAVTFRTTGYFLERIGLNSLDELPELAPHLPNATELEAELSELAAAPNPAETLRRVAEDVTSRQPVEP
jgi:segregation and condensation protein B